MKYLAILLLLAVTVMATVHAQFFPPRDRPGGFPRPGQGPGRPLGPTFPKPPNSPFGPNRFPRPPNKPFGPSSPFRFSRSINNGGGINWNVDLDRGKPSWNVGADQKIYENKHGSIRLNGGIGSHRGGRPQGQIGISGGFKWG